MASIFEEIAKAKVSKGGNWIKPGEYELVVKALLMQPNRKKVQQFIAELVVLKAKPGSDRNADGTAIEPSSAGSEVTYLVPLDKDAAAGNVKAFVLALLGYTEAELDAEEKKDPGAFADTIEELVNQAPGAKSEKGVVLSVNSGAGMVIGDRTYEKENQGKDNPANKGKMFTAHNWFSVENTEASIAAQKAAFVKKAA